MQIVVCENHVYSAENVGVVVTHELIHMYDHCRARVDWQSGRQLACAEIRAASLSGDCFFWREAFDRLNFALKAQHQASRSSLAS